MPWHILAIGRIKSTLPAHDEIHWLDDPQQPADAVALFDGAALPPGLPPALPVIEFSGETSSLAADFAAPVLSSPEQLDAMLAALAPISERLGDCSSGGLHAPGSGLDILCLSHSRAQPIRAARDPASPATLNYPLLRGRAALDIMAQRTALESLAGQNLLERRFAARVLCCPACRNGRLAAFEACTACGSGNLTEEAIVHHYRCGFQDGESRFLQGNDLICPKCNQELRHFGVDYGRPGVMQRCLSCMQVMSEPQPRFHCLDCHTVSRGEQARPLDWFDYSLTERGIAALRSGELPAEGVEVTGIFPRTFALKDFVLLLRGQLLVAQRYRRPLTLGRIGIGNLAALRQQAGIAAGGATIRLFSQILVESLRDTDFVSSPRDDLLLVAMPETSPQQAEGVFTRIGAAADRHLALPVQLEFEAVPAERAGLMLDELAATA
ncbi:hypothetical protein FNB15_09455 [Ferrovibrio terrae]|uniref:Thaumarchaeal output domain-containing protein n=1 Tax=Ferrovibrio terrae TaxID=2594003 RepID=A0A516H131_9PROT|nr:hypothetical protein [Ferrovibrio terrae]QDO97478.1 hypothetical protein FNB15_09455 [Ferrovibrio terrae]